MYLRAIGIPSAFAISAHRRSRHRFGLRAAAFTIQTLGPRSPDIRNDYTRNLDAVLVKSVVVKVKDREITTSLRAECFNLTNTPQFSSPNGTVTSQSFGQVTSQRHTPRQFQHGMKIKF